jgi:excinuclease UvrABC nuclease subunit
MLRFGNDFFRSLPEGPGVYFFHGSDGRFLYIGQSSNLRSRLGSYRHVGEGKHPRRTLRLVARIARIEWRECASADEVIVRLTSVCIFTWKPAQSLLGTHHCCSENVDS